MINETKEVIHTHKGKIHLDRNLEYGECIYSTKNKKYYILKPTNEDINLRLSRKTNTFLVKDLSMILGFSSLDKNSVVLEIGTGSGAGTIFLANFVKKVLSIDINFWNILNAKENIEKYGNIDDVVLILSNHYVDFVKEKMFDGVVIDLPEPEIYSDFCARVVKDGGDLIFAVPNIEQVKKAREVFSKKNFVYFRTIEVWVRKWLVRPDYCRPYHEMQAHSMFFTFCKKIK
ncbi:MAG: methyltransferase domain-containing protein [Candidatus Calescibacterium sp.]|nr:methyltransferase domain-containing protein [Candidatus Calescibacterium sp.]MCX7972061.1 methyltransferase domain-containing protein [bacterium]MDW8194654.1 methyltransferase domain-containing protein [Candidatus Calescibacterium sp.]